MRRRLRRRGSRSSPLRGRGRVGAARCRGRARASRRSRRDGGASPGPRPRAALRRARLPSTTSRSAAPAMKSATTASTAMPQPAIAMPVWPVGTKTRLATPRRRASRSSSSETVIFPIAQSEPTVRTMVASTREVRAGGRREVGRRAAQIAQLDAAFGGERAQLRVVAEEHVQAVLDVEARVDARRRRSSIQAGGKRPPCVTTPTSAVVGP